MKQSPKYIHNLRENEIFVFGSNLKGIHGAGAALQARKYWGAIIGVGEGLMGRSYAIPTKDENLKPLPLEEIKWKVKEFLKYASNNRQYNFLVTEIGCGLAAYEPKEIAPLFKDAIRFEFYYPNVYLPESFIKVIQNLEKS